MLLFNSEVGHVLLSHSVIATEPSKEMFLPRGLLASSAHKNNPLGCQMCDWKWNCKCQKSNHSYGPTLLEEGGACLKKPRTITDEVTGGNCLRAAAERVPRPQQPNQNAVMQPHRWLPPTPGHLGHLGHPVWAGCRAHAPISCSL